MNTPKEGNDLAQLTKQREKNAKELAPIIEKIESEFSTILSETRVIREQGKDLLRFEQDKHSLQKYIKQVRRDLHETNSHLATSKAQNELSISKIGLGVSTLKQQIHSLQRTVTRRDDYFQSYDKKLNGVMQALSKHQALVNDRLCVFEEKFKQLTKDTLEMTKEVRRDFEQSSNNNLLLKNELTHKIKLAEEKEKILDLYMSEREEIPKKIHEIYTGLRDCLKQSEFEQFKSWHQAAINDSLGKAQGIVESLLTSDMRSNISKLNERFKDIEELKGQAGQVEGLQRQVDSLGYKIDSLETSKDQKLAQIREETEVIEEKIIDVIDKKIQNIQETMQHHNLQTEETIEQKLQKLREELLKKIEINSQTSRFAPSEVAEIATRAESAPGVGEQISRQLELARVYRQQMEAKTRQIISLAEGINSKLSLFSNRITMCRSDIQIFIQSTGKELKKIGDLKKEGENHMEEVGKLLSDVHQALILLTSLSINAEKKTEKRSFVTYNDGIVLEIDQEHHSDMIHYRKCKVGVCDLRESLLLGLIEQADTLCSSGNLFKWDKHRPSRFFERIKESLASRNIKLEKSPSIHLHSPRRKTKREGEDFVFDLKMESQELIKHSSFKPSITINNSNILWTCQKPKSQMQKRYKLKRTEQKARKQSEGRNCFTASRSQRKTKMNFL